MKAWPRTELERRLSAESEARRRSIEARQRASMPVRLGCTVLMRGHQHSCGAKWQSRYLVCHGFVGEVMWGCGVLGWKRTAHQSWSVQSPIEVTTSDVQVSVCMSISMSCQPVRRRSLVRPCVRKVGEMSVVKNRGSGAMPFVSRVTCSNWPVSTNMRVCNA